MPFLKVNAIIGNQACQNGRRVSSLGRMPLETARNQSKAEIGMDTNKHQGSWKWLA